MERLLSLLQSQPFWTTAELREQLQASARTLRRDLNELREQGYPLEASRGRGGGISLKGRWGIRRLHLSDEEIMGLLVSLAITESLNPPMMAEHIVSARQKIAAAFPERQRQNIQRLRQRILIGGPASTTVLGSYQTPRTDAVKTINTGFMQQRDLSVQYLSEAGVTTERHIEPQYLLLNWPVWYLSAWDHLRAAPRLFRIDRILSAEILDTPFPQRPARTLMEGYREFFQAV